MRLLIFDFDGVLADTQDAALRIIGRIAARKRVATPTLDYLRNHHAREIMGLMGIRWWELPYYVVRARRWIGEERREIRLFPWCRDLLESAQANGCQVVVVSSNSEKTIRSVFEQSGLSQQWAGIHGGAGIFSKRRILSRIVRQGGGMAVRAAYVGDEARDIEAARAAGIRSIAITWGYQSEPFLRSASPDYLVRTPQEFAGAVRDFSGNEKPTKISHSPTRR